MMPFFDFGGNAKGVIAIGGEATGIIAIGQMAHGVIAIGQLARGVIAVGQVSIGIVTVGQLSMGLGWCLAQLGLGARGMGGVLKVLPAGVFEKGPDRTSIGALQRRDPEQGWVDLWLDVPAHGAPRLLDGGSPVPVELPEAVARSLPDARGPIRIPISAEIHGEERVAADETAGYREAPPRTWALVARGLTRRPSPVKRAIIWTLRAAAVAAMATGFWLAVAAPFVDAF